MRTILTTDQVLPCSNPSNIKDAIATIYNATDHNGFASTIQLADGSYDLTNKTIGAFDVPLGANQFYVKGNLTHPENVVLYAPAGGCCLAARDGGIMTVAGMKLTGGGIGLSASQFGVLDFAMIDFGSMGVHQQINGAGAINCADGPSVASRITGSAVNHISITGAGGNHAMGGVTMNVSSGLAFTVFVLMNGPSMLNWGFNYYNGSAAGVKSSISNGAVMSLNGTVLPGT